MSKLKLTKTRMRRINIRQSALNIYRQAREAVVHPRRYVRSSWQESRYRGWRRWVLGAKRLKIGGALAVVMAIVLSPLFTGVGMALTAGPNNPTANNAPAGWTTPGYIYIDDFQYATYNVASAGTSTALNATGFGFAVPSGATINGVQVDIDRYSPTNAKALIQDSNVQLVVGGVATGTNLGATTTTWPPNQSYATYGGSSSLWGATLTPADVNAVNFGATITAKNVKSGAGATNTAYIDHIRVTVTYTPAPVTYNQASYRLFNNQDGLSSATANLASDADYTSDTFSRSVVTADVNNDGKLDVIAAIDGAGIDVLSGNGDGTLGAKTFYSAAGTPNGLATADFNGDGKADIVTSNMNTPGSVSVLLNSGTGTFPTHVEYATTGNGPLGIAAADLNGDGKADIVTSNNVGNSVSVLLNSGTGTFAAAVNYVAGSYDGVALVDVNGDGKRDIITYDGTSTVSVLLNNGDGTFAAQTTYPSGSGSSGSIAVGDLNGDGKPDIVTASGSVSVLLNNGDGTFAAKVDYAAASGAYRVAIADMNRDGKADIITGNNYGSNQNVSIFINSGSGTFGARTDYAVTNAYGMTVGDLNSDGVTDVITSGSNTVSVRLNTTPPMNVGSTLAAQNTAATIPGDGQAFRVRMDVGISGYDLAASAASLKLQYAPMTTSCDTSFTNTSAYSDVTDTSTVRYYDNPVAINGAAISTNANDPSDGTNTTANGGVIPETYQEKGTTNFTNPTAIPLGKDGMWDFALTTSGTVQNTHYCMRIVTSGGAQLNTYSVIPEIITPSTQYNQAAYGWFNSSNTTSFTGFTPRTDYTAGSTPRGTVTADFNGDGKIDVADTDNIDNTISIFLGNGTGGLGTRATIAATASSGPNSIATGDFNGDGKPDLVVGNGNLTTISVFINTTVNGAGIATFTKTDYTSNTGNGSVAVNVGDFNGDGKKDIVVGYQSGNSFSILLGTGTGSFNAYTKFTATASNASVLNLAVGDFNGDNKTDVVVRDLSTGSNKQIAVFLNTTANNATTPTMSSEADYSSLCDQSLRIADFNGDGASDIIQSSYNSGPKVCFFTGTGTGTFNAVQNFSAPNSALSDVTVADFNNDGKPDFVVSNYSTSVQVYLNTTSTGSSSVSATLSGTYALPTNATAYNMTNGDINGDGIPDIVTANANSSAPSISIFNSVKGATAGNPLAAASTPIIVGSRGSPFRLRLAIGPAGSGVAANGQSFKLQYALKSATCSVSTYADVTTVSPIAWYDNTNLTGGGAVAPSANDPSDGTNTNVAQTYQESNNFTNSGSAVYVGQDGLWDFSLILPASVRPSAICMRVVKADGTPLNTYGVYPELQFGPKMVQLMRQGKWFDSTGKLQNYFTTKY